MPTILSALSLLPGFERELRLLPLLLRAGHMCIDVGASLGIYAFPMAILVGAAGRVIAFEPRKDAARWLSLAATSFGLRNLQVEAAAVGCRPGRGTLTVPRRKRNVPGRAYLADGAVCDGLDEGLRPGASFAVPVVTLDGLRTRLDVPIDFIKCDVEGGEVDVLTGAVGILSRDRPVVMCEIESRHARRYGRSADAAVELVNDLGYMTLAPPGAPRNHRNHLLVPWERTDVAERLGWTPRSLAAT